MKMKNDTILFIQSTSFLGAFISSYTPVVSFCFMVVSTLTGLVLLYKFFTNKK